MPPKPEPRGMSGGKKAAIAFIVLLILAGAGFAFWWFLIRKEDEPVATTTPPPTISYVGRIYGNTNLSKMYYFVDSSTVKVLQTGQACSNAGWKFNPSGTSIQIGSDTLSIQDDNTLKDTEQFDRMTGDIDAYCKLIGSE